jgi:hypothetical protein
VKVAKPGSGQKRVKGLELVARIQSSRFQSNSPEHLQEEVDKGTEERASWGKAREEQDGHRRRYNKETAPESTGGRSQI